MKATSGATAVQIVYSSHRGSRDIEHIGSAHGDVRLGVLKAAAWQRMAAGQGELEPGPELAAGSRTRGGVSQSEGDDDRVSRLRPEQSADTPRRATPAVTAACR